MGETTPKQKRAWPLFLLAGLSFVPGFGFLIGSVAAGWGLVSSRPRALVAAAIGAGGALLNLVGFVLMGVFLGGDESKGMGEARVKLAEQGLVEVVMAIEDYRRDEGRYPPSLLALQQHFGLRRPVSIADPSAGIFGLRPFQYRLAPDGSSYELFAVGLDRQPGTEDDIRPALPDSLVGRVGLRGGER